MNLPKISRDKKKKKKKKKKKGAYILWCEKQGDKKDFFEFRTLSKT